MDENNVPDMRPTFEEIRKVDDNGKEYWSSRELCNAMGYSGYWKFQNVIDKAIKVASEKGMDIDDHFNHVVEMVKLGSGSFRKVEAFHLSRMACMIISENADSRKLLVKQARAYFSQSVSTTELMRNSLESNILLYKTAQGETRIEVIFNNETFWMSQKKMAALFGVDVRTISYHIGQIYETGELDKMATIRKIGIVQTEGERDVERAPLFYNLDVIIAVGYRVNSYQATQFRIWATSVLKEFIIKGYVLDDERLKQGKHFGKDYFDDLLERIREIRTSERRYYQKITDIYAECSADYDAKAESTKLFYKMVQNMMHLAVTNHTAASELMRKFTTMEDWKNRLKLLLETMDYDAKSSAGKVSQEEAREKAYSEYEKYKVIQDRSYISDFDRFNSGNDDDTPLLPFDIDPKE
ncbi:MULTISPECIES: RhuM family protein [Segatella]|nr:RhuM family protein [Segatella copri]